MLQNSSSEESKKGDYLIHGKGKVITPTEDGRILNILQKGGY